MANFSDGCKVETDLDSGPNFFFCVYLLYLQHLKEHFDGILSKT